MNAYQRVMNTIAGLPADRVPVLAVLGSYGGKLTGIDLKTLYSDATAYVAAQQVLQTELGFDLVMTAFNYSAITEAFGGEVAWSAGQTPNMKRPAARSAQEALHLPLPDPQHAGRLPVMLESTRKLAALYKEKVPVIAVLPGPAILPSLLTGMEQWMEAVLFDQKTTQNLLEYTGTFFVTWANALLEAGADCLVITEGMAAAEIAPRNLFAELFLPHIRSTFSQVRGPMVFHHTGGRINQILDLLPGLDGLVGVAVGSKDDLTEARRLIGPDLTLIGNLDNLSIPSVSATELYRMSMDCLRTAAPSGRFILANAGADIPLDTPIENLKAITAASNDYAAEIRGAP